MVKTEVSQKVPEKDNFFANEISKRQELLIEENQVSDMRKYECFYKQLELLPIQNLKIDQLI